MANLPKERLISDKPPFTMVGMDFFGPFQIKQGRSLVKRYGVIFTCLSIRAVHLEIAHSMDTDSCINAIRRLISRRGNPEFIRSDNGTNLVGAEREMREEIERWNIDKINNFMLQKSIKWAFNPPAASHFWRRVGEINKIMEAILNNRPISEVSEHVDDLKVLTPNHLLLLRPGEYFPPGTFCKTDNYVRRRWRQIQYLADIFWKRWTHEYLPLLQSRQKWNSEKRNLKIGDIVLIQDNTPRNLWNLGRIIEVLKDKSDNVRIVRLKTYSTTLLRPVASCVWY
ncbi:unnamed protein product [Mytilus edulis]|uniref:DUF5641 domain-containing protein n=1 Tax=Mytilus edulis TaxID=6550 RepID=A0A8S3SAE3_MYTED|nr:unnamed protein product [Mytilus edulis]